MKLASIFITASASYIQFITKKRKIIGKFVLLVRFQHPNILLRKLE